VNQWRTWRNGVTGVRCPDYGLALAALIVSPAVYLLVPLLMPFDLMPHGLRKAIASKVTTGGGRDLLKHMLADFENAVEHAAKEAKDAAKREKSQEA
jgi:hypothetical protein